MSGGEFPVPGPSGMIFRQFGISMETHVTALGGNRVRIDIAPEVSERDMSTAVQAAGVIVPGLVRRRMNTQLELAGRETVGLGGLIARRKLLPQAEIQPVAHADSHRELEDDVPHHGRARGRDSELDPYRRDGEQAGPTLNRRLPVEQGPGAPWWGMQGGLCRFLGPLARRRPGRREISEGVRLQAADEVPDVPSPDARGLQCKRCGVGESSTLVPQRERPLCLTVPHWKRPPAAKGVRPP